MRPIDDSNEGMLQTVIVDQRYSDFGLKYMSHGELASRSEPYRIIVAGSRNWPRHGSGIVDSVIDERLSQVPADRLPATLVHGACPTGLDAYVAWRWPQLCEAHPADWRRGRQAGPERNQKMVELGADACEVFLYGTSKGTVDLLLWAFNAGLKPNATALWPDGTMTRGAVTSDLLEEIRVVHAGHRRVPQ